MHVPLTTLFTGSGSGLTPRGHWHMSRYQLFTLLYIYCIKSTNVENAWEHVARTRGYNRCALRSYQLYRQTGIH